MTVPAPLPSPVAGRLAEWRLTSDGELIATRSSWVLPVRRADDRLMLKVARIPDEAAGYRLMVWWDGDGAAEVVAAADGALLMERGGGRDLAEMARTGADEEACRILCRTAARLHAARAGAPPELHPLEQWFQPLFDLAAREAMLAPAAGAARALLADPRDVRPLHGDLHHDNVLDFGDRGWRAIDPHGLVGERTFDFANIFTNPDLGDPSRPLATLHGRFEARLAVVKHEAGLEPRRLLQWILAWTGLSAAWFMGDGDEAGAGIDLTVGALAQRLLQA